ncbi:hypothetical protein [Kiloniella litopenaei]|uniref:hypothetical protein n=1 Tax=Kiloniella litopenaei TaxID=1549748 RepID=UPI0012FE8F5B|nr:hypothetical protein [Kiloniella litopenaei]
MEKKVKPKDQEALGLLLRKRQAGRFMSNDEMKSRLQTLIDNKRRALKLAC